MLELKKIRKVYNTSDLETVALNDVSVAFREKEFVAILGTSGSGKTTCLNIIGGLDRYDSGELTIKGKKTTDFKDSDWDAYRNNSIGFVFQSYNLIMHLSIVANVELGMTLSGVSKAEKHRRAVEVLKQVGLEKHIGKKPNQLSGGQMQRVAIARALANDPEILLCDEPTGALDSTTSVQIMDLIKEVAKDRLVVMVTHNPELAEAYADRIIRFQDGDILSDTNPYNEVKNTESFNLKKTSMKFTTALALSLNNIKTKLGRTFLTSFASSIGIIGIAVILSLSTGFQKQVDNMQQDTMAQFPIMVSQSAMEMDAEKMKANQKEAEEKAAKYKDSDMIYLYNSKENVVMHKNVFTDEYIEYIENIDTTISGSIGYTRITGMNILRDVDGTVSPISLSGSGAGASAGMGAGMAGGMGLSSYPTKLDGLEDSYVMENYDILAGEYPTSSTDLVLVVGENNRLDLNILTALGFDVTEKEDIKFSEIINTEFKLINNNDYYMKSEFGSFLPNANYEEMYQSEDSITLTMKGIVRVKEDAKLGLLNPGVAYSDELTTLVIEENKESDIVKAQLESDRNVMTMEAFDEEGKQSFLSYLGGNGTPFMIMIYPTSFEAKDDVLAYLDGYNEGKDSEDHILYTDLAGTISSMTGSIMDAITIVLIAFAAISLVTSMIMISIITYTSVLERTKEIGVLKALGARRKDITRVFNAETFILGLFSGTLGVVVAWLITIPVNKILYNITELENVAQLEFLHGLMLIVISTILTMIGGNIPARLAAKKDAVEALRSE